MSVNMTFGTPITTKTLEDMPKYKDKETSRMDRAREALQRKYDKYADALKYVHDLKERYGNGVSTLCLIYNATGDPITFVHEHNWHGHIWDTPNPAEIANGQWGGFLHVHPTGLPYGSLGAIVYRGLNNEDGHCDWMACWYNPWSGANKAHTEVREAGHYDPDDIWDLVYEYLEKSDLTHIDISHGCKSIVSIKQDTSPEYEATFTLDGVDKILPSPN